MTNPFLLGDLVYVKPGYGRKYLVPQGKSGPATDANVAEFVAKRDDYVAKAKSIHDEAAGRRAKLEGASRLWCIRIGNYRVVYEIDEDPRLRSPQTSLSGCVSN